MPSACVSVFAWRKIVPLSPHSLARLKPTSLTSAPSAFGASVGVARVPKSSSLACSNGATASTPKSSPMPPEPRYKPSSEARLTLTASSTPDGWSGYDGLVDLVLAKHFRVNHGNNEFVKGSRHVNGIESFWSYAKHRLAQFHGVRRDKFELHLKETEFRFNH